MRPRWNLPLLLGGGGVAVLLLVGLLAPWLAPHDPMEQDLLAQNLPPFWSAARDPAYLLGTDSLGRDLLSRLIWGVRPALLVMLAGTSLSGGVGMLLGLVAGYLGGWADALVSRTVEVFMSFPPMLLAIVLAAVIGPGLNTVILAVALIGWTRFARVMRAETLKLREQDFVLAARLMAVGGGRILFGEILPNLTPIALALLSLEMGRAIVVEAVLAFIGFSSSDIPTWGGVVADGRDTFNQAWWVITSGMACILASVLLLNLLGDGLRRATQRGDE